MAVSVFTLVPFLCNQFGFDRDGFRTTRRFLSSGRAVGEISPAALRAIAQTLRSISAR